MLTTTTARIGTRAHRVPKGTSRGVAPTCAALTRYREQQTRAFRFPRIWASCLDPEAHREVFRRHRRLRHKYAETLNRRLSWENHPYADDARRMLKSAIRGYWRHDCWPVARHVNTDARRKTPDNPTGVRPGNNIEDAERGAMEHLLFGDRSGADWPSTFQKPRGRRRNLDAAAPMSSSVVAAESQGSEAEYTIDPITNRKVTKASKVPRVTDVSSLFGTGLDDTPANTPSYQPQFTPFNPPSATDGRDPIFYDGPPPEAELRRYGPVKLDTPAAPHQHASSIVESEEYENNHAASRNKVTWHPNEGIAATTENMSAREGSGVDAVTVTAEPYQDLDTFAGSAATHRQPYDDLRKYRPVGLEEDLDTAESGHEYSDLSGYNTSGFRYLEPNGRPAAQEHDESASEAADYRPFQLDEDARAVYDEPRAHPTELGSYQPFGYNEPDGKPAATVEDSHSYDPLEVRQYQAFRYNEPDGKPEVAAEEGGGYDPAEVQRYQAVRYNEPDGKPLSAEMAEDSDTARLREYQQSSFSEADVQQAIAGGSATDASEAGTYGAVKYNEPDGQPTEQLDSTSRALNEFDKEQKAGQRIPYLEPTAEERAEDLDLLRASDIRASFSRISAAEPEKSETRDSLESSMSRHAATSDAVDQEAASSVKVAKQRSMAAEGRAVEHGNQLTGNYTRDFPEDFARSWSSAFTPEQSSSSTSSSVSPLVQPALDRQAKQRALDRQANLTPRPAVGDQFSQEPQGLETSYEQERAATSDSPVFIKEYGNVEATSSPPNEPASQATPATLYKILAYDQTTQAVTTAETTSHTSKTEPSLTPAEVLPRLSHPSQFLPHFAPLHAAGYELVSGGGDVLVFRKVHHDHKPSASPSATSATSSTTREEPKKAHPVNPIDMTGSRPAARLSFPDPAIGRFASPTGFVSYDIPGGGAMQQQQQQQGDNPVRKFVSGIDVRREEEVFSGGGRGGGEEEEEKTGRKKTGLGKRMAVGAAWVAGVSYALGVLGEYFRTGGSDGLGPRGF